MTSPIQFRECNTRYGAPDGLASSQVKTIPAFHGEIVGGSCDGLDQVVVGYQLAPEDIERLAGGAMLYVTMLRGLTPHFLSLDFESATHPA